jgi:dTDP-4-amino-4,6-dideoxygalactose transaminase
VWNEQRRQAATRYRSLLVEANIGLGAPHAPDWVNSVYHLYVIRVQDRDGLMKHLAHAKVGTGIHYPVPLHLQKAYEGLHHKAGDFPVAEKAATEIISLPMFPQLTEEEQRRVVSSIQEFQTAAPLLVKYAAASY